MDIHTATEEAYKKGYEDGKRDAVKRGRWVQVICHEEFEDGFVDRVKECCSVCHAPNWRRTSNYCPNCGARMDGTGDV